MFTTAHDSICATIAAQADAATDGDHGWADYRAVFLSAEVQDLIRTRLSKMDAKRRRQEDEGDEEAAELSIKISSMDGSSVVATVPKDAKVKDVKASIMSTLKLPRGQVVIHLHAKGVEEQLPGALSVQAVCSGKEPNLFMFQNATSIQAIGTLQRELEALKRTHKDELTDHVNLIDECFEFLRGQSDGESCQICGCKPKAPVKTGPQGAPGSQEHLLTSALGALDSLMAADGIGGLLVLEKCRGRCKLMLCRACRPVLCQDCDSYSSQEHGCGDCCKACFPTLLQNKYGKCRCDGCTGRENGFSRECREGHCTECAKNGDGDEGPGRWSTGRHRGDY
jgi:hypothetical protein